GFPEQPEQPYGHGPRRRRRQVLHRQSTGGLPRNVDPDRRGLPRLRHRPLAPQPDTGGLKEPAPDRGPDVLEGAWDGRYAGWLRRRPRRHDQEPGGVGG